MPGRRPDWLRKPVRTQSDFVIRSDLPSWIIRALRESGIRRLSIMADMSDHDLLLVPGIGRRSLALIREEIARTSDHDVQQDLATTAASEGETGARLR